MIKVFFITNAASILLGLSLNAANVASVDPTAMSSVSGLSTVLEGNTFTFNTNTADVTTNGTNRTGTIKTPPPNNDNYLSSSFTGLDTSTYRYAQVYYSLDSDFSGTNQQLRLDTSDQSANFVTFNNSESIASTSGSHSFIIDFNDGSTDLGGGGYSGDLNYLRWDWFNSPSNDGKSLTLDRIVFSTELSTFSSNAGDTLVFYDNFNTSTGVNNDLNTRQDGSSAGNGYSGGSLNQGRMTYDNTAGDVRMNANLTSTLTDINIDGFRIRFEAANTGTNWVSPYLNTNTSRGNSTLGMLLFQNGNISLYQDDGGGGQSTLSLTNATLVGLLGTWDHTEMNEFEFVASKDGTYSLMINGVVVASGLEYSFDGSATLQWAGINNTGGLATYDNLAISTYVIPEPSLVALLSIAGVSVLFIRRRRSE